MIPWFQITTIDLGPIAIQAWGLMVALGFLFGAMASARVARSRGLDPQHVYQVATWILIASMIGGRLFHVFFYDPAFYLASPGQILAFWNGGMSIYGGFAGAIIAAAVYFKRHKLDWHTYAAVTIFGLPIGIAIGRIGCFLIHDHPGTATHFWLGVQHPDGIVRHDLGLYESLNMFLLALVFAVLAKRKVKQDTYLIIFCWWYGLTRFLLDFLRTVDARYFSLTPGQYLSALLVLVGSGLAVKRGYVKLGKL